MNPKDYEDYQKNNVKASKSQLKEYIQIYADMAKKLKSESAVELEAVKDNIRKTYPTEIYFTLVDELNRRPALQQEIMRIAQIQNEAQRQKALNKLPDDVKQSVKEMFDLLMK